MARAVVVRSAFVCFKAFSVAAPVLLLLWFPLGAAGAAEATARTAQRVFAEQDSEGRGVRLEGGAKAGAAALKQAGGTTSDAGLSGSPMQVFMDTTCSDCQRWIVQELQPLWGDDEFREYLLSAYDIVFMPFSVTRHQQGPDLNRVLLCAQNIMPLEDFIQQLFVWESTVEAWAPNDQGTYDEVLLDMPSLVQECFPQDAEEIETCSKAPEQYGDLEMHVRGAIPDDLGEVPFFVIGEDHQGDHAQFFLKEYLCARAAAEEYDGLTSSCAGAGGSEFFQVKEPPFRGCPVLRAQRLRGSLSQQAVEA